MNLFPPKLDKGFNGHQFTVAAFEQPPFVYRRYVVVMWLSKYKSFNRNIICRKLLDTKTHNQYDIWDGNEVRLLKLVAKSLNFGINIVGLLNANESVIFSKYLRAGPD